MLDLKPIYDYANEVLSKLRPEDIDGAINWGDLSCTDVEECRSVHDDFTTVRVTIEEADPSNPELCEYMYEAMVTRFPSVAFCISPEW